MPSKSPFEPRLLGKRYLLLAKLGEGGMGEVYEARDTRQGHSNRVVAIKVLTGNNLELGMVRRFVSEAEALSEAGHPHIVTIYELGIEPDEPPFIVMERLRGEDLAKRVGRAEFEISYAVDILLALCSAISFCHSRRILHRDLKPENVYLHRPEPHVEIVKLIDFGVSKHALANPDMTGHGLPGTLRYMSPEQVAHRGASMLSDQYALALLLHVLLTRTKPFATVPVEQIPHAIEHGQVSRAKVLRPEVPAVLDEVIAKAMNVEPTQRFGSVDEFAKHLLEFASPLGKSQWSDRFTKPALENESQLTGPRPGIPLPAAQLGGATNISGAGRIEANQVDLSTVRREAFPLGFDKSAAISSSVETVRRVVVAPEFDIRAASGPTPSAPPVTLEGEERPRNRKGRGAARALVILITVSAAAVVFVIGRPRTIERDGASKAPTASPPIEEKVTTPSSSAIPVNPPPVAIEPSATSPVHEQGEPSAAPVADPATAPVPTRTSRRKSPKERRPPPSVSKPQPIRTPSAPAEEPIEYRNNSPILR